MKLSRNFLLNAFLIYSSIGWIICVVGIVLPAMSAFNLLREIGGIETEALQSDPIYTYWLRMASSVFTFIGVLFLLPIFRPSIFKPLLPYLGIFMIIEGLILMIHGIFLHLPLTPMWGDVGFCLVGGTGILLCLPKKPLCP